MKPKRPSKSKAMQAAEPGVDGLLGGLRQELIREQLVLEERAKNLPGAES